MEVSYACVGAPDVVNEDLVVAGPDFAVVLDGSTAVGPNTGCVHGVAWLVSRLGAALAERMLDRRTDPLPDLLSESIAQVAAEHGGTCDLTNPDSPSSTVAILREHTDRLDYLVLADSPVLFDRTTGTDVVVDDRLAALPSRGVESVRRWRNRPGGFWVAGTAPEAAYEAVTGTVDRRDVVRAALLTDGVTRLVERFAVLTWAGLMAALDRDGPMRVVERVRREEHRAAASGERLPGKRHDDASAVLCRFAGGARGRTPAASSS